jgi:hypothetical protein
MYGFKRTLETHCSQGVLLAFARKEPLEGDLGVGIAEILAEVGQFAGEWFTTILKDLLVRVFASIEVIQRGVQRRIHRPLRVI